MPEKLKSNNIKSQRAFTLIEVFVAVSILSIGLVGAFSVLPVMIKNQSMNSDSFLASQIANEGMEIVRNIRDNNWLVERDWRNGLTACGGGCEIDYNDAALQVFQNRALKIDSNGFYNYESGVNGKFTRKITIVQAGDALDVKVEVFWNGKGSPFLTQENLYDWR